MTRHDCPHKINYANKKSYSNHRRWCIGDMSSTILKMKLRIGDKAPTWKGNLASYKAKHEWVRRWLTKPKTCRNCSNPPREVANLDQKYSRNLTTWQWMCTSCHRLMDYARLRNERGYARVRVVKL